MAKFLSKALSSLGIGKKAAKKRKPRRPAKPASAAEPVAPAETDSEIADTIESLEEELVQSLGSNAEDDTPADEETAVTAKATDGRAMTPERRKLIREALAVHRSQAKLLDELSPQDRERLRAMARKALLGE